MQVVVKMSFFGPKVTLDLGFVEATVTPKSAIRRGLLKLITGKPFRRLNLQGTFQCALWDDRAGYCFEVGDTLRVFFQPRGHWKEAEIIEASSRHVLLGKFTLEVSAAELNRLQSMVSGREGLSEYIDAKTVLAK